jgi:threonine synthase
LLYVTTRNDQDTFTTNHVLTQNWGTDGGLFVPLNFPKISAQEWKKLSEMSFGQCVAEILNLFFSTKLTGWDVDFSIGRYPARLEQLAHRIFMAETWHNPQWQYQRIEKNLMELLSSEVNIPGNWVSIAIRMAVLAGILGHREISDMVPTDIAVVTGDFTLPISAWYLRKMGFPIGNIICCCNENNQFWELFCNGQMRTDVTRISTIVPEADVIMPVNLERLISDCSTIAETERYLSCNKTGTTYSVSDGMLQLLRRELFVSVVSSVRIETTIPNVYKTHNYILSPASALAYSGLLDYRAKTGITRNAIVICDQSPVCDAETVARVMDIPLAKLQKLI